MKVKIKIEKEFDVRYLKLDAGVRYWQDADVNGEQDVDFYKSMGAGTPLMPFAVKVQEQPTDNIHSNHYRWQPTIDVEKGCIVDWPTGVTANVHYKVCDEGTYTLLDADKNEIVSVDSYVPDCIGEYGDYIIMRIDENGVISNFSFSKEDVEEIIEGDFNRYD